MFDCHYDLLTYILMKKNNITLLKKHCKKIYNKNNITGGIFNLFYMSKQEIKEELGIESNEINIIQNLIDVKQYIYKYKLIPNNINYIFGIEGLDYLQNINDIDILYSLGLRSTNPVWNNANKFGGGTRTSETYGLTDLGKQLIHKLIEKGIAIDLSHTNEKTFWDIIQLCDKYKKSEKNPIVFASHSNAKKICNVPRNLTDNQIRAIKELDGIIGIVSIKKFCIDTEDISNPYINFKQKYIDNINYIKQLLGGIDNICVATDDMSYYTIHPEYYQNTNIYKFHTVKKDLSLSLKKNNFTDKEIKKILELNFKEKILSKLKND